MPLCQGRCCGAANSNHDSRVRCLSLLFAGCFSTPQQQPVTRLASPQRFSNGRSQWPTNFQLHFQFSAAHVRRALQIFKSKSNRDAFSQLSEASNFQCTTHTQLTTQLKNIKEIETEIKSKQNANTRLSLGFCIGCDFDLDIGFVSFSGSSACAACRPFSMSDRSVLSPVGSRLGQLRCFCCCFCFCCLCCFASSLLLLRPGLLEVAARKYSIHKTKIPFEMHGINLHFLSPVRQLVSLTDTVY